MQNFWKNKKIFITGHTGFKGSCDALGGEFEGQKLGSIGDIGTFSFYPAHHITMGEGGAVALNNPELYKIAKSFRDWGRDCSCPCGVDGICKKRFSQQLGKLDHKYTYSHIGYNLKITDWQASIATAQLDRLDEFIKIRTQNANFLNEKLKDLKDYLILPKVKQNVKSSWFGYLISVKENAPFKRNELINYLENKKIATRLLFAGNIKWLEIGNLIINERDKNYALL